MFENPHDLVATCLSGFTALLQQSNQVLLEIRGSSCGWVSRVGPCLVVHVKGKLWLAPFVRLPRNGVFVYWMHSTANLC